MSKMTRIGAIALACAIVVPVAGCGGGNKTVEDGTYVARDVSSLYSDAQRRLTQRRYADAAKLFDEVERQHPYSIWARRAQLLSSFSHYMARDYTSAISSSQRFLTIHPGNVDAPYAHYLIAMSYYEELQDVTRDQRTTQQAYDAFGELVRRYPNSRYAADGRTRMNQLSDQLAGKEMELGRFYERSGRWLAANMRFRNVIDKYQTSSHTPEALHRLVETYLALGIPAEAQKSAAVLAANYPGSEWYRRSYALMQRKTRPAAQPQG
ncbi:MAG: outer membrane protein assembly factor BamD [Pseudomonadota bacterium]|nr:outer membrane protein assembly factor BamD [Sphingomonas sp.]MDQ3479488.1 outer membrane protein assembly factor BamD [Pseudomonadota bacterium]